MDKRALSAIPRPILTDENKKMPLLVSNMCYLVTASRQEVGGGDTLIINFFRAENKELRPAFRTFCQMDDYITQDLSTDKVKWKTGAIDSLTGYLYWRREDGNIVIASVPERDEILSFLQDFRQMHGVDGQWGVPHGTVIDMEIEYGIDGYQGAIKEWKLHERHRKEKAEIEQQMEKFGGLPEDYGQFVKDTVFDDENYIFYSRPKGRAYCTKCGHDFELRKDGLYHKKIAVWNDTDCVKHNKTVRCPYCNRYLMCKSEGMGRNTLFAIRWSVLVQKYGEEVLVRYFRHTKELRKDFRNPEIESIEMFRTVHAGNKSIYFEWGRFKNTRDVRWCYFTDRGYCYGYLQPSKMAIPRSTMLYNTDLLEAVSGTCMKYSAIDIYVDKVGKGRTLNSPWCIDRYFSLYRKNKYLEQLLKVGFYQLANAAMEDYDCPEFKDGRTILETLQVDKLQFNMLRKIGDPSVRDLEILQYAGAIRQGDFDILRHIHDDGYARMYRKYLDMRQYTTIYKLDKYINKQRIVHDRDYFDYARWMEEMGYDMRNEFNLYPRDFQKAHDDKSKEYTRFKDKKAKEDKKRFKRLLEELRNKADVDAVNMRAEGMFIRLPSELDELKHEGEMLHHCVGTYREKVAKGDSIIFFIRLEAEPDRPFYTLEWRGRVIQCRGYKNCDMTPEVKAFVDIFQQKMMECVENGEKVLNRRKAG